MREKSIITFENQDGSKKAIITVTINEGTMDVDIVFEPEIEAEGNKDIYAIMAAMFMKQLAKG